MLTGLAHLLKEQKARLTKVLVLFKTCHLIYLQWLQYPILLGGAINYFLIPYMKQNKVVHRFEKHFFMLLERHRSSSRVVLQLCLYARAHVLLQSLLSACDLFHDQRGRKPSTCPNRQAGTFYSP